MSFPPTLRWDQHITARPCSKTRLEECVCVCVCVCVCEKSDDILTGQRGTFKTCGESGHERARCCIRPTSDAGQPLYCHLHAVTCVCVCVCVSVCVCV